LQGDDACGYNYYASRDGNDDLLQNTSYEDRERTIVNYK